MTSRTLRVGTRLTVDEGRRLRSAAISMGISKSEAIRHAINLYVSMDEQERDDEKREMRRVRRVR